MTEITSTRGLAIKGVMARPAGNHEALVKGNLTGDRMTLIYGSVRREQVSPRKWRCVRTIRLVQCERRFTQEDDDFWWVGVSQTILSTDT